MLHIIFGMFFVQVLIPFFRSNLLLTLIITALIIPNSFFGEPSGNKIGTTGNNASSLGD